MKKVIVAVLALVGSFTAFADTSVGLGYTNQGATLNAAHRFTGTNFGVSGAIGLQDQKSDAGFKYTWLSPDSGDQTYSCNMKTKFGGLLTADYYLLVNTVNVRVRAGLASVSGSADATSSFVAQGFGTVTNTAHSSYGGIVPALGLGFDGHFKGNLAWGVDALWLDKSGISNSNSPNQNAIDGFDNKANLTNPATILGDKLKDKQQNYLVGVWIGYAF
jgi:hypothetical protein